MARKPKKTRSKGRPSEPLPHGLSVQASLGNKDTAEESPNVGDKATIGEQQQSLSITGISASTAVVKRPKSFPVKLGVTPFPKYKRPTRKEVYKVHQLLTEAHGEYEQPKEPAMPSATVAGCGDVPFILEAVIRTIISAATHMENANTAIKGLLGRFRVFRNDPYAGSVDWNQVRVASRQDLINALPGGVMPGLKAGHIQATLQAVWEDNNVKRQELKAAMNLTNTEAIPKEQIQDKSGNELERAKKLTEMSNNTLLNYPHILTLDYMHAWDDADVFYGLQKYSGVGPKVAACVMLFCMQRPRFAVDTHCHRLCKWLGWVPNHEVNDHKTFAHCDVRIPDELKFSLHQLMIAHGKDCKHCNAKDITIQLDDPECPLEDLLNRVKVETSKKRSKKGNSVGDQALNELEEPEDKIDAPRTPRTSSKRRRKSAKSVKATPKLQEGQRRSARILAKQAITLQTITNSADKQDDDIKEQDEHEHEKEEKGEEEEGEEEYLDLPSIDTDIEEFELDMIDEDEEEDL